MDRNIEITNVLEYKDEDLVKIVNVISKAIGSNEILPNDLVKIYRKKVTLKAGIPRPIVMKFISKRLEKYLL